MGSIQYIYKQKLNAKITIRNNGHSYETIELVSLIDHLKCTNIILILKNYYLRQFSVTLTDNNWLNILKSIFKIQKYNELTYK